MLENYLPDLYDCNIAVIGMGYVGLPLALAFSNNIKNNKNKMRKIVGFDINEKRIIDLKKGLDKTNEISKDEILSSNIKFTSDKEVLSQTDVYIVTVPTPIDINNIPDLTCLKNASEIIGISIKNRKFNSVNNPIVIFESTVYPGATEEFCVPIIEAFSNCRFNSEIKEEGFFCGYSPERINPGDKNKSINKIVKVTSGSTPEVARWVDQLYSSIIEAGTYPVSSIKVAEAAKVIENTQRDINIALVNELAIIFNLLQIDTNEVIDAASTKWNFMSFRPGLVGGHCIGIDPYYLTYKAQKLGYHSQVVLAGRRINEEMANWVANKFVKEMLNKKINLVGAKVLIMGFSFKENCSDIRNNKVIDLVKKLEEYNLKISVYDPLVDKEEVFRHYSILINNKLPKDQDFKGIILAVAHDKFKLIKKEDFESICKDGLIFDLKGILDSSFNALRI